jgi:hypothetical protein
MRRLLLTLLAALVVLPTAAAFAAFKSDGDGVLELRSVYGNVTINASRGVLWGQVDRATLRVSDPNPLDGTVYVSGWDQKYKPLAADGTPISGGEVYTGTEMRFRVTGGKYRLAFKNASRIDLTAVGVGTAALTGDPFAVRAGDYSLDGGNWTPVPVFSTLFLPFGQLVAAPSGSNSP